jgi:histidyl-tRNA synthetase
MPPKFQNPKGTRDFYPLDQLRRRYITESWRAVSLRHGFEEIDGPTFERLSLYTVKSGDEIVSQLFSFQREGGDDTYALRPEFTPTLARMYAARAAQLPKPVRWFCTPTFFRAEKPQRGRLREFGQWNCDILGSGDARYDHSTSNAEIIVCLEAALRGLGLARNDADIRINDRNAVAAVLIDAGVPQERHAEAFRLLDASEKLGDEFIRRARAIGLPDHVSVWFAGDPIETQVPGDTAHEAMQTAASQQAQSTGALFARWRAEIQPLREVLQHMGCDPRVIREHIAIVRGLAYYTGTVFEVIAEGERAVAGGGRYDNLVELFGGPPTPACGFGMGDVVLANLLADKGLMPDDHELPGAVEAVTRSQALRPEVFVVPGSDDENGLVTPLVARLRRGVERAGFEGRPWDPARYDVPPLHARTSDKATRNLKKLLADAEKQRARLAAVVHSPDEVQLKRLDTREEHPDNCSIDPDSPHYLGRVASTLLGRAPTPSA